MVKSDLAETRRAVLEFQNKMASECAARDERIATLSLALENSIKESKTRGLGNWLRHNTWAVLTALIPLGAALIGLYASIVLLQHRIGRMEGLGILPEARNRVEALERADDRALERLQADRRDLDRLRERFDEHDNHD